MNRTLFRWHRRIGITSALFVFVLAMTGLLLLFSNSLNLDKKTIRGTWVAKAYNQTPKSAPLGIDIGQGLWVVGIDKLVYIGDAAPVALLSPLLAVGKQDGLIALETVDQLILVQMNGQVVERLAGEKAIDGIALGPLPNEVMTQSLARYAGEGMPISRVILDIHTGRLFGRLGPWVMGLASILLIILSLTGIVMWSTAGKRRRRRERLERHASKRVDQGE